MNDLERTLIIEALTTNDIIDIKNALLNDDTSYLTNIIQGNDFIPLKSLTKKDLLQEFKNRFIDDFLDEQIPSYIPSSLYKFLN